MNLVSKMAKRLNAAANQRNTIQSFHSIKFFYGILIFLIYLNNTCLNLHVFTFFFSVVANVPLEELSQTLKVYEIDMYHTYSFKLLSCIWDCRGSCLDQKVDKAP